MLLPLLQNNLLSGAGPVTKAGTDTLGISFTELSELITGAITQKNAVDALDVSISDNVTNVLIALARADTVDINMGSGGNAFSLEVVHAQAATGGGQQTITVSGKDEMPLAVHVQVLRTGAGFDSSAGHSTIQDGYYDGTNMGSMCSYVPTALGNSDAQRFWSRTQFIHLWTKDGGGEGVKCATDISGTGDGLFQSGGNSGLKLTWDVTPTLPFDMVFTFYYGTALNILMFGSASSSDGLATADKVYTHNFGNPIDFMMISGFYNSTEDIDSSNGGQHNWGFYDGTNQVNVMYLYEHLHDPMQGVSRICDDCVLVNMNDTGANVVKASVKTNGTNALTLQTDGNMGGYINMGLMMYLGGNASAACAIHTKGISTGAHTETVSQLTGITPDYVRLICTDMTAVNTTEVDTDKAGSFTHGVGTEDEEFSFYFWNDIGNTTTDAEQTSSQKIMNAGDDQGNLEEIGTLGTLKADGFDIVYSAATAVAKKMIAVGIEYDVAVPETAELVAALNRTDAVDTAFSVESSGSFLSSSRTDAIDIGFSVEAAGLIALLTRTENVDIGFSVESAALSVNVSTTDTADISFSVESAALLSILQRSDNVDVAFSVETAALLSLLNRTDNVDISFSELSDLVGAVTAKAASDNIDVSFSVESAALLGLISVLNDIDVSFTESVSIFTLLARSDTLGVSFTESAQIAATLVASDNVDLSLSELVAILTVLNRVDSLDVTVAEAATNLILFLNRTDAVDIDFSVEDAGLFALLNRTDAVDIALSVETAIIASFLSASDAADIGITGTAAILALLGRSDAVDISLAESKQILSILSLADALDVSFTEVTQVLAAITAIDDADINFSAEVPIIVAALKVVDALDISFSAEVVALSVLLSRTDAVDLSITEVVALINLIAVTNDIDISLTDAAAVAGNVALIVGSDAVDVNFSAETSALLSIVTRLDALDISFAEAVSLLGIANRTDAVDISLGELAQISGNATLKTGTDAVDISFSAETTSLTVALNRTDALDVSLSELVAIFGTANRTDSLDVSVVGAIQLLSLVSGGDSVAISFAETVGVVAALQRGDTVDLSVSEALSIFGTLVVADSIDLSIAEAALILNTFGAADNVDISLAESLDVIIPGVSSAFLANPRVMLQYTGKVDID